MEKYLDREGLAKLLNVPVTSVDYYRRKKGMPCVKIGRHKRYVLKDVQRWLNHNVDNN